MDSISWGSSMGCYCHPEEGWEMPRPSCILSRTVTCCGDSDVMRPSPELCRWKSVAHTAWWEGVGSAEPHDWFPRQTTNPCFETLVFSF